MARKVTLQTIADHLGVSRTTVSNAYNRPDQLAPELRERVLATAASLGYSGPDAAARRLRSGGREAIGLLSPGSIEYAFIDPAEVLFMAGLAHAVESAGLGILMSAIGVYGVVAYSVARRSREFSIRLALGASAASILRTTLSRTMILLGLGTGVGLALALAVGKYLSVVLYGANPRNPFALGVAAILMILITIAASWIPARRAARIEPAVTLKTD